MKNKRYRRFTLIINLLLISLFLTLNSVSTIKGYEWLLLEDEVEYFVVEELENGTTYEFSVTYNTMIWSLDVGFSIYQKDSFRERDLILTTDNPGSGFEQETYIAQNDGDFYLKVWINNHDSGLVSITVEEQGTGLEKDISRYRPTFLHSVPRWIWIVIGVCGGVGILAMIVMILIPLIAVRKHKKRVAEAREKGLALPRTGRRKDKCPFCGVKLPPESMVTCLYCGAPITDE